MYLVLKKFYDPFEKRYILSGETIDIPDKYLEGYKPYIIEKQTEVKKLSTIDEAKAAPPMQIVKKKVTKKKVK